MNTDTQRLDWLATQTGIGLIHDDFDHWAVAGCGFQNIPENVPDDIQTSFFIEKNEWKPSIREAIDAAMTEAFGDSDS